MNTEITKIEIKIGEKKVELTLEEAKELKEILNETFGKKEVQFIPSSPVVIERQVYPYRHWDVWYGSPQYTPGTGTFSCSEISKSTMTLECKSSS